MSVLFKGTEITRILWQGWQNELMWFSPKIYPLIYQVISQLTLSLFLYTRNSFTNLDQFHGPLFCLVWDLKSKLTADRVMNSYNWPLKKNSYQYSRQQRKVRPIECIVCWFNLTSRNQTLLSVYRPVAQQLEIISEKKSISVDRQKSFIMINYGAFL